MRQGGHLTLEHAVKKITGDTAQIWNLPNRGLLRPGHAADVVVFDPERSHAGRSCRRATCPEGGMRYVRNASGVDAVIVNGEVVYTAADGYSDALPGTLATI